MRPLYPLPLPLGLALLGGCAFLSPGRNPALGPATVEVRGDTAVCRSHYRAGGLRSEVTLVRGEPQGARRLYFANGTPEFAGWFRDGAAEGEAVTHFPDGKRRIVEYFLHDTLQVHRSLEFDSTGARISEWMPAGDSLTGSLVLRRNGQVVDSTYYIRGKKEGLSFSLGTKGDTVAKAFYRNGKWDSAAAESPASGTRSTESILKTIRRHTPDLRHTYNAHLANSRFGGKVTLQFRIRPDGSLDYVLPIEDTSGKPRFVRDVITRVQDWRFQSIDMTSMDIVTVPFTFSE
jgi:antitoxin component YwqK of YwqJK toxin-antitoxin module